MTLQFGFFYLQLPFTCNGHLCSLFHLFASICFVAIISLHLLVCPYFGWLVCLGGYMCLSFCRGGGMLLESRNDQRLGWIGYPH